MSARSRDLARAIRRDAVAMTSRAKTSHVGSCLSIADILAVLYADVLRHRPDEPDWPERDRVVISKGHAAAAGYSVLARSGYFDPAYLERYCTDGAPLAGHLTRTTEAPGVEHSTGSLGHGLPVALGMALHAVRSGHPERRVFALLSDGECDEGTTWESALIAGHHRTANLVVIIDANGIQSFGRVSEVADLEPFADKWRAFGWAVRELDGHNHDKLLEALTAPAAAQPTALIARTVKGKGVSFMEDRLLWHYRSPDSSELAAAEAELDGDGPAEEVSS